MTATVPFFAEHSNGSQLTSAGDRNLKQSAGDCRGENAMSKKLDLVMLEVVRNALPAISNEMALDLQRTSYNMMIYEVRDFCTAVVNPKGELISQNVGGVSHFVADLGVVITDAMEIYGADGFHRDDALIMNHPAVAGQHLNNVCIYTPYFYKGELLMFTMVRAHWIDVGGQSTGFGAGRDALDSWMEGIMFNQLKLYDAGERNEMLYRMIADNIRFPESSMGDLRSQMAACRLANRRLDELFARYGKEDVLAGIEQVFDETEQHCRNVVSKFKNGTYEVEAFVDDAGEKPPGRVRVHAKVIVDDGAMIIDLSGCAQESIHGPNCRSYAGAYIAYKALTAPTAPVNEGSFRACEAIIPEGNMMMARHPLRMAGWSLALPTVADIIVAALAPAIPETTPAGHHGYLGGIAFFGTDPKTDKRFVVQSIEGGGWGGRPDEDGPSGTVSICQGDVRNGSIEAIEIKCPVMIESRRLRPDSGGAGKNRGGLAVDLHIRNFVEGRWNLSRPYRRGMPPWGLWGGAAGDIGDCLVRRPGENDFKVTFGYRQLMPPETEVIARMQGGGGWGDPLEREPERVEMDVREECVSRESARADYGVVLNDDLSLDLKATRALRKEMTAARAKANGGGNGATKSNPLRETGPNAYLTDLTVFATGVEI